MVGLHATADASGQPFASYDPIERAGPLILRAFVYTARTELFLVISVFLLLLALESRPKNYAQVIRIQAKRLLLPFGFWVVFYAFFNLLKATQFGYSSAIWQEIRSPQAWLGYFLLGDVKYHMHFIPTLFAMLLFFPIFKVGLRHPWSGFVVVLCLLCKREADVYLWSNYVQHGWFDFALRAAKICTYLGYGVVAGSMLYMWRSLTSRRDLEKMLLPALSISLILFIVKLIATYKTAVTGQWQHNFTPGYWADFLMPVLLFWIALALGSRNWPIWISVAAPFSFGIYLCHPIFLDIAEILIKNSSLSPMTQVGVKIGFTIIATVACVLCLSKLKPFAWTIGLGPFPDYFKRLTKLVSKSEVKRVRTY